MPTPKGVTTSLLPGGTLTENRTYCLRVQSVGRVFNYYGEATGMTMLSRPSNQEKYSCTTTNSTYKNVNVTFEDCGTDCVGYMFIINTTPGGYLPRIAGNITSPNRINPFGGATGFCGAQAETSFAKANATTLYTFNFSSMTMLYTYQSGMSWGFTEYYPAGIPFINVTGGTTTNPITPQDIYDWLQYLNSTQEWAVCSPKTGYLNYNGSIECGTIKLYASIGEMGTTSYGSVFNIPNQIMLDQEWGKLTFNDGGNWTMGNYYATTDGVNNGGVYRRTSCYPAYNQVFSYDWDGSFLGGGYTIAETNMTNYGVGLNGGHYNQISRSTNNPLGRIVSSIYYGAGRIYPYYSKYTIWKYSTAIVPNGGWEFSGGKYGFSDYGFDALRIHQINGYSGTGDYVESIYWNLISSGATGYNFNLWTLYRTTAGNTTIARCVNCELIGRNVWVTYSNYQFNSSQQTIAANQEYTTSIQVVDQNGVAIPGAAVSITNSTGQPVGFYKLAPDYYGASGSSANWSQNGAIVYFGNTSGVSVGDVYLAGVESFRVDSILNYSAVNATRGYGSSRINPICGSSAADPSYAASLNFYRANTTWTTNNTGHLPVLAFILNSSQRIAYAAAGYSLMDYAQYNAPFIIGVNASGYQNATYYYTPNAPATLTFTLMNATACDEECNATVVYINTASGLGTSDSFPATKRVKQPATTTVNTNAGDFPAGLAAGMAIVALLVVSGYFAYQRFKKEEAV